MLILDNYVSYYITNLSKIQKSKFKAYAFAEINAKAKINQISSEILLKIK